MKACRMLDLPQHGDTSDAHPERTDAEREPELEAHAEEDAGPDSEVQVMSLADANRAVEASLDAMREAQAMAGAGQVGDDLDDLLHHPR